MSKRIIICADGTWNQVEFYERDSQGNSVPISTNVAKLAASLAPTAPDEERQMLFYMEGVGTAAGEGLEGGAFGFGLSANILRAYSVIVQNYEPGDRLYFFGFSRGAFTVRSLAGMIRTCGILRHPAAVTPALALELYSDRRSEADPDLPRCQVFRRMHSHESQEIECIGVWDTVGSLGSPSMGPKLARWLEIGWHFHDVKLGSHVRNAFHALAIHERRGTFPPTLWELPEDAAGQNLVQCWFPGVHSDVGGGYPMREVDGIPRRLSDVPLRWMIEMVNGTAKGGLTPSAALGIHPDWARSVHCDLATDGKARRNESWKGVFKVLDLVKGRFHGNPRSFTGGRNVGSVTNETVHPSAAQHFEKYPEGWPPGFM